MQNNAKLDTNSRQTIRLILKYNHYFTYLHESIIHYIMTFANFDNEYLKDGITPKIKENQVYHRKRSTMSSIYIIIGSMPVKPCIIIPRRSSLKLLMLMSMLK